MVLLLFIFWFDCAASSSWNNSDSKKEPYKVYRLYPKDPQQLEFIVSVWTVAAKYQLNFWKDPSKVGIPTDIMVPAFMQSKFEKLISDKGLDYTITIQDVKKLIVEKERLWSKKAQMPGRMFDDVGINPKVTFDFTKYHDYDRMRAYMRHVEREYPHIAKVYNLGYSHENRPIEMIKISHPLSAIDKKAIWVDAGIHAREWASSSTAIYFIHQLVTRYDHDPAITQYVQNITWYIAPLVNPDGYMYTRSSSEPEVRMWRKNRAPNTDRCLGSSDFCCKGVQLYKSFINCKTLMTHINFQVDLNRNFDFHWSESGASSNPCDEIYEGSAAFSEPEAKAIRDFVWPHRNEIEAVITMHTYSQLWIHPFGHQRSSYPEDLAELKATAMSAVKALERLYGTKYRVGSGADTLYPAAGGSDDWSKSKAGIKYVYLLELRPEEFVYDGFVLDPDQLIPCGRETWAGVRVVADRILQSSGMTTVESSNTPTPLVDQEPLGLFVKQRTETSATMAWTPARTLPPKIDLIPEKQPAPPALSIRVHSEFRVEDSSSSPPTTETIAISTAPSSQSKTIQFGGGLKSQSVDASGNAGGGVCVDKIPEKRCSRWMFHRTGICQRISEYMSKNCAKSCGFCNVRS
uniref:Zinc carboxypeptidase A 1 n=1 Tax=Romanomermis culicivorax TaxID=13658 RepID=A0A915JBR4_ROMCU